LPFDEPGQATQVFSGLIRALPFTAFEYVEVRQANGKQTTTRFSVATIPLPSALPWLRVQPQNLVMDTLNPLDSRDIDFESGDFNRAFRIAADSDEFAFAMVHPRMMEFLLTLPRPRMWSIHIEGVHVIAWRLGPQLPHEVVPTVTWLAGFVELIPPYVYDKFAVGAVPSGGDS
jgi:hypothetical protein